MRGAYAWLLIVSLAVAGTTGCEQTNQDQTPSTSETPAPRSSSSHLMFADTPPWQPVWPEGTTFNDTTRDVTMVARTAGLEAIVGRNRAVFGDSLRGMISVRFVIYPDGSVGDVSLKDESWSVDAAADVTDSLLAHIEQWRFPPGAKRPLAVNQPWKFEP